jgi:hypothetical protein
MAKEKNQCLQVLVLDADRNPIKNLPCKLYFNGAMIAAETGADGLTKRIESLSPGDEVKIAIARVDNSIKIVARVIAEGGNKLVTLISPRVKVVSPTLPHAAAKPGQVPTRKEKSIPIYNPQQEKIPTSKKEFGLKSELTKNKEGNPVSKVEGDIPDLDFLDEFNGEQMTE